MATFTRKPTAKKVFSTVKPVVSKHVEIYFDQAVRVTARTSLNAAKAKFEEKPLVLVSYQADNYLIPYKALTTDALAIKALKDAFKNRDIIYCG